MSESGVHEHGLHHVPIRDLGLRIEGTRLERPCEQLVAELVAAGITGVRPRFYLSTEWGVAFDTIAIAIPLYLARPDLEALHMERDGHLEGFDAEDVLRYLRHEAGHAVSYAYKLYALDDWTRAFGAISQPYVDEYRPKPFDRRFVRHLPGWYAQKHPDEDWAETFAVWLGQKSWRADHAESPVALAKLELCERLMKQYGAVAPVTSDATPDEPVEQLTQSLDELYARDEHVIPPTAFLDGSLRSLFHGGASRASALLLRLERPLMADVYRWTGHFPERTRALVRHLASRADALALGYDEEADRVIAVTALVTSLAMNHVYSGSYVP